MLRTGAELLRTGTELLRAGVPEPTNTIQKMVVVSMYDGIVESDRYRYLCYSYNPNYRHLPKLFVVISGQKRLQIERQPEVPASFMWKTVSADLALSRRRPRCATNSVPVALSQQWPTRLRNGTQHRQENCAENSQTSR